MKIETFTGTAVVFGVERSVSVVPNYGDGSEEKKSKVNLYFIDLTIAEAKKIIALAEAADTIATLNGAAGKTSGELTVTAPEKAATKPRVSAVDAAKAASVSHSISAAKPASDEDPVPPEKAAAVKAAVEKHDAVQASKTVPEKPAAKLAAVEDDEDEAPASALDNDPWGLSQTAVPDALRKPEAKFRDLVSWVQEQVKKSKNEVLTEAQLVDVLSKFVDVPLIKRMTAGSLPGRVHGVVQMLAAAGPSA